MRQGQEPVPGARPLSVTHLLLALVATLALLPPLLWLAFAWRTSGSPPWSAGDGGTRSTALVLAGGSCALALLLWPLALRPALLRLRLTEERIVMQGRQDALTGMFNREGLRVALARALRRRRGKAARVGVVVIDIDRFHLINDSMGQPAGDEVLRNAADRIRSVVRENDVVARLVADRFVVQVSGQVGTQALAAMSRNLLRAFEPACSVAGREMVLTPSIGTATADENTNSVDELLKCAELALRAAKAAGGGSFRHFQAALLQQHDLWLDMEHRLRHTLHTGGFALAFQPIVDGRGEKIVAVEALLRWPEPGRSQQVSPVDFVPVLEQTGLIVPVGRWVMQEACRQALQWLSEGAHALVLSVNVSPRQFAEADFAAVVAAVLAETGFPATRLQIEVTEGLLLGPSSDTLRKLELLVKTGVRLAVDDFGIGHSSLAYLKTFPLHTLKIDRMFVRDLAEHARDRAIARAIIELGHSLGLKVTAEGVETAEQAHTLRQLGCDTLQGFLFARPASATDFKRMLALRGTPGSHDKPHADWSDTMAGLMHARATDDSRRRREVLT